MNFNRIRNIKSVNRSIDTLRINERGTIATLNSIIPEIVEGIIAGDNVAVANNLVEALQGGRRKEVTYFLNHCLPHTFNSKAGRYGKKIQDEKQYHAKVDNFIKFKQSGMTVFTWIKDNVRTDVNLPDYSKRAENAIRKAITHGLTADQILDILNKVVESEAAKADDKAAKVAKKREAIEEVPFANVG